MQLTEYNYHLFSRDKNAVKSIKYKRQQSATGREGYNGSAAVNNNDSTHNKYVAGVSQLLLINRVLSSSWKMILSSSFLFS